MTTAIPSFGELSDPDLLARLQRAAEQERLATAELIALLMELDTRRLYLAEGCSSLFTYCTQVLHLSEHAAYGRIEAARAARRFPIILQRLAEGNLTLTAVGLLAPHLTAENCLEVLSAAQRKSKREVEHLVARLRPGQDVPSVIRKLPEIKTLSTPHDETVVEQRHDKTAASSTSSAARSMKRPSEITPLAPERYKIQFTVNRETYERLRRAQDLLRHTIPNGDPAAIFERALKLLISELSKKKLGAGGRPHAPRKPVRRSRHIPRSVRRAVWERDNGRCAFKGSHGQCTETAFLEFHHIVPFAAGGRTVAENIELRCRAHNLYEAVRYFGPWERPTGKTTGELS